MSFELPTSELAAEIAIAPAESLKLHETVVGAHVEDLVDAIEHEGIIRDPIIVDRRTNVVLDGMHRVSAARRLGLIGIPACYVDYTDPRIQVGSWLWEYRDLALEAVREQCIAAGLNIRSIERSEGWPRSWPADPAAASPAGQFVLAAPDGSPTDALILTRDVLADLKVSESDPRYCPDSAFTGPSKRTVVIVVPRPDKGAIVRAAGTDGRFPPNTSRHVIPARPMGIEVPLDILEQDTAAATDVLDRRLVDRSIDRLPPGSEYAGRIYEEALLVFR